MSASKEETGLSMNACLSVLHFTNSTLWGGVEEHVCALLQNLSRTALRAHLVCSPVLVERFRANTPAHIEVRAIALDNPRHVGGAVQLARLLRREKFDILHSHMFWSSLFASPIGWACGVPAIVETLHGAEAWRSGWKASYRIDRAIAHLVSRYVAVSSSDATFLASKKRVPAHKISIIHNGVNIARYSASRKLRDRMRKALGFCDDDQVLILVARFHEGKGHPVLLAAMHQLLPAYPNLRLICLGEGETEIEIRRLIDELGLRKQVRLLGYQANVPDWLGAADINVLPTYYEGFPLTVLEAMATGLPTVASNVGGIPEAIEDGVSGMLVPPGSPGSLASALSILLGDREMRQDMGDAAFARASRRFSIEQQVRNTERLYQTLVRPHGIEDNGAQMINSNVANR